MRVRLRKEQRGYRWSSVLALEARGAALQVVLIAVVLTLGSRKVLSKSEVLLLPAA